MQRCMEQKRVAEYRNNFDAIRLAAASMVIISHQFALIGLPEPVVIGEVKLGVLAVFIFFSLSGYLVAQSWRRDPNLYRFLLRRALRIWPAFAVVVVVMAAISIFLPHAPGRELIDAVRAACRYLGYLVLWSYEGEFFYGHPHPELNGSLWTIPFEVGCYLIFGMIGLVAGSRMKWVGLAVMLVMVFAFAGTEPINPAGKPRFVALLVLGLFFTAGTLVELWSQFKGRLLTVALIVGAILLGTGSPMLGLAAILAPLVIYGGEQSWPVLRSVGAKGDVSFGLYLWAWPVQQVGVMVLGIEAPYAMHLLFSFAFTFALAMLSWHVLEAPALRLKPSRKHDAVSTRPTGSLPPNQQHRATDSVR